MYTSCCKAGLCADVTTDAVKATLTDTFGHRTYSRAKCTRSYKTFTDMLSEAAQGTWVADRSTIFQNR